MAPKDASSSSSSVPTSSSSASASSAAGGKVKWIPKDLRQYDAPVMGARYEGLLGRTLENLPLLARLNWLHIPLLLSTPLIALYGIATSPLDWRTYAFAVAFYFFSGLGITAGYHRHFAHRAYKATTFTRGLLLLMGAAAVEGSAKWWSRDHRAHHRFVDTEQDPYSAARGFFYAHVGWMLVKQDKSKSGTRDININDLTSDPLVAFQHKYYLPIAIFMAFVLPTLVCGLGWGDYWGGYFIAGVARLVFVHHSTFFVNSLAHWAGAATYTDGHTARNSIITAFLTLGEGYHNFHHEFPSDYRNGVEWWQYDPTKIFIWCLARLGLAYDLIETPREEIRKGELQMMQKALEKKKQVAFWGPHPDYLEEMTWAHFQSKAGQAVKKEARKNWVVLREDQREGEAEAPKRWFVLDLSPILDKENYSMAHPGSIALLEGHVGEDITTLFNHHKQAKEGGYYKHSNTAHNIACTLRIARLAGAPPTRQNAQPNMVIILIGNKSDLERREVTYDEGAWFARQNGLFFLEASAKTGQNVDAAFLDTARQIYENLLTGMYDLNSDAHGITVGAPHRPQQSPLQRTGTNMSAVQFACCGSG